SGTINLSNIMHVSMLNNSVNGGENSTDEINNEEDNINTTNNEVISVGTLDATNILDCHPADHQNSKIELQYLFSRILTQPSFVNALEQD
ncbi:9610_t:CDS:2, partial [Racocetra fulgida]